MRADFWSRYQSVETRPGSRDDFHAELSQPGQRMDPRAMLWQCTSDPGTPLACSKLGFGNCPRSVSAPPQRSMSVTSLASQSISPKYSCAFDHEGHEYSSRTDRQPVLTSPAIVIYINSMLISYALHALSLNKRKLEGNKSLYSSLPRNIHLTP